MYISLVNIRKEELKMDLQFDYYYGAEAEQFSFYRVPRMLIKDEYFKGLSSDAKLLYGLMLDRMGLSIKNGWFDNDNRAYIIYTIENIMEDLGCGKDKAVKVVAELDQKKGIGLIEKVRRGLGKPDIIYVKNFIASKEESTKTDESTEVGKTEFKKCKATWLYIDEFHVLLNSEYTAKYLQQLWKKVRKQGGLCTGITQNVVDLLQNYTATTMLANSEFVALLKQANTDSSKMAEVIGVSEAQLRFVTNTSSGMGLIKCGSVVII